MSDFPSSGGFHKSGGDATEHLTGTVKDKNDNQMYFHRLDNNTYWDRIHIPRSATAASNVPVRYEAITEQQYRK